MYGVRVKLLLDVIDRSSSFIIILISTHIHESCARNFTKLLYYFILIDFSLAIDVFLSSILHSFINCVTTSIWLLHCHKCVQMRTFKYINHGTQDKIGDSTGKWFVLVRRFITTVKKIKSVTMNRLNNILNSCTYF